VKLGVVKAGTDEGDDSGAAVLLPGVGAFSAGVDVAGVIPGDNVVPAGEVAGDMAGGAGGDIIVEGEFAGVGDIVVVGEFAGVGDIIVVGEFAGVGDIIVAGDFAGVGDIIVAGVGDIIVAGDLAGVGEIIVDGVGDTVDGNGDNGGEA